MNLYDLHKKPKSLDHHADAPDLVPKLAWEKYEDDFDELRKREALWARDTRCASYYASDVLNGPFPAGEAAIAKDPYYAYEYAIYILKARFPIGEPAIAKEAEFAYKYALVILEGRFPKGEAAIAKNPWYAYEYAYDILKGPFPAGEKAILVSQYRDAYLQLLEKKSKK